MFVLVLQIVFGMKFGVFFQGTSLMEITPSLTAFNQNIGISRTIDDPHGILFGLRIICQKTSERWFWDSMPNHDVVEVMVYVQFNILVHILEVMANVIHDTMICFIVYVATHGGPLGDAFDMIGHDPNMLEIQPSQPHYQGQPQTF